MSNGRRSWNQNGSSRRPKGGLKSVDYSERFLKSLRRLPERIVAEARRKEEIFRINPFDPRLRTHKLHGKEEGLWAFWVIYRYRVKFLFLTDEEVLFLDIGTHDIYR